ncbi:hypothetical protein BS78_06G185300 [Paspalum vaginatum]|nr:hypothetical protein BS78_06G185300 [Paspalum vaginatum]
MRPAGAGRGGSASRAGWQRLGRSRMAPTATCYGGRRRAPAEGMTSRGAPSGVGAFGSKGGWSWKGEARGGGGRIWRGGRTGEVPTRKVGI